MNKPTRSRPVTIGGTRMVRIAVTGLAMVFSSLAMSQPLMKAPGAEVTPDDVKAVAQRMQEQSRLVTLSKEGNVHRLSEEILLRRLLALQAEKAGVEKDAVVQAQLRQARERVLSDARLAEIEARANPGAEVLRRYASETYRADPSKYQTPEQWRARHILIVPGQGGNARERVQLVQAELRKGVAFDTLAKQYSDDKGSAPLGGDLGWVGKGAVVKEFQAALEALQSSGDVSDVVETQFGLHLIRLEGHRKAGQRTFEEVSDEIEKGVLNKLQSEARQAVVKTTLQDATTDAAAIQAVAKTYSKP
ncbi:MAG TPA: peptidylprolyl isomerase [Rubrivivax sp.]|nr:peptidylprolyl isomerase [Rubrivivax sp.]